MSEPVKASIKLRCAVHSRGAAEFLANGFTRELARDHAVVDAGTDTDVERLRPGRQVTLAIELPPFRHETPRILECGATLVRLHSINGCARLEFEIYSMAIGRRADRRS